MNPLGNIIKSLLDQRGLTAKKRSKRINLSETSLSEIVQGITKSRKANLTPVAEELCKTAEKERKIISTYAAIESALAEEQPQLDPIACKKAKEPRVRRYPLAKAQSIAFRDRTAAAFEEAGISYQKRRSHLRLPHPPP